MRGALACAAFLVLVGGAWLVGAHSLGPSFGDGRNGAKKDAYRVGWIIHEKPDGLSCAYAAFDTVTERVGQATTTMCESVARKLKAGGATGFAWGD